MLVVDGGQPGRVTLILMISGVSYGKGVGRYAEQTACSPVAAGKGDLGFRPKNGEGGTYS